MRIVGFNFAEIIGEKKKDIKGKLEIKSKIDIEGIEKDKNEVLGEFLKFNYIYNVFYEPEFAQLKFKGTILVRPENNKETKKVLEEWKDKKLSEEVRIFVYNFILTKCNLKAMQLEEDLVLPTHIPLPRLTKQQQQQASYTG